jgi:hypothetical protein
VPQAWIHVQKSAVNCVLFYLTANEPSNDDLSQLAIGDLYPAGMDDWLRQWIVYSSIIHD